MAKPLLDVGAFYDIGINMGSFGYSKWNRRILETEMLLFPIKDIKYPPRLPGNKWSNYKLQWIEKHRKHKPVLQKLSYDIIQNMESYGADEEKKLLGEILNNLSVVVPKNIPFKKSLPYANLLIGIINLWAVGKEITHNELREFYYKKLSQYVNPLDVELFERADIIFENHNKRARELLDCLIESRKGEIIVRGKKVSVRRGIKDESLAFMVEQTKQIGYNDALKKANEKTFFQLKSTLSPEEFHLREIDIQNKYKEWRKRQKEKSNTSLPIVAD